MARLVKPLVLVLATLGLLTLLFVATPIFCWLGHQLGGAAASEPRGATLIVLASDPTAPDGVMGTETYMRTAFALRQYKKGGFDRILVSGGGTPAVADSMRDFLLSQGVPSPAIEAETRSRSTRESALFCRNLLANDPGQKVLLTSDYHMFRAARTFQNAGVEVTKLPMPEAVWLCSSLSGRLTVFVALTKEVTKITYYFVRGWI